MSENDPYSCSNCIAAIPDPADDGEDYTNRDFDHEEAIWDDFYA